MLWPCSINRSHSSPADLLIEAIAASCSPTVCTFRPLRPSSQPHTTTPDVLRVLRVGLDHLDVPPRHPLGERMGEGAVDFDAREVRHLRRQQLGREPRSRPDLKHIGAEVVHGQLSEGEGQGEVSQGDRRSTNPSSVSATHGHTHSPDWAPRATPLRAQMIRSGSVTNPGKRAPRQPALDPTSLPSSCAGIARYGAGS